MPQIIPFVLAATAVAGVGLSIAGMSTQTQAAKRSAESQKQIAADQLRQEQLRKQAMELDNRRRRLEAVRQMQRARAIAVANANNQGGLFGSGLQGGFGQISGQSGTNFLGLSQSLALGRANFDLNADISSARFNIADASSQAATGQGYSSLGGALIQSMGPIERLSGGFFPGSSSYFYGTNSGNYGGTGGGLGGLY